MLTPLQLCHACPGAARPCPCPCPQDGRPFTLHAEALYCPLGRFGTADKPTGWDEIPREAPAPPRRPNDVTACRATCETCDQLGRVQPNGLYVDCNAAPMCCGGGVGEVSLVSGRCPVGKWG